MVGGGRRGESGVMPLEPGDTDAGGGGDDDVDILTNDGTAAGAEEVGFGDVTGVGSAAARTLGCP